MLRSIQNLDANDSIIGTNVQHDIFGGASINHILLALI
jgi:hypothetical protein